MLCLWDAAAADRGSGAALQSGRRLLQDGRLVQAGVELQTVVQTDAQNAQPVQTAIKNSLAQPYQLVNVYKSVRITSVRPSSV